MLNHNKIKRPLIPALVFMTAGIVSGLVHIPLPLIFLPTAAGAACLSLYKRSRQKRYYYIQFFLFFLLFIVGFSTTYIHENYDKKIIYNNEKNGNKIAEKGGYDIQERNIYCTEEDFAFDKKSEEIINVYIVKISATVEKIVDGTYSKRLMLRSCRVNGKRMVNNIVLEISDSDAVGWFAKRGDYIELEAEMPGTMDDILPHHDKATNPGQFDLRQYYKSLGYVYYIKDANVILVKRCTNLIITGLERLKLSLKEVYAACCTQADAGVYEAMVTGDKTDMDDTIKALFTAAGIGHILAISGLHISLIGMGIYRLLRRCGFMCPMSAMISGCIVILFGVMTGNAISAIRAIIMFVCAVMAQVLGRRYDILSAMSLSAIIIMLGNPYVITNSGFLLSFMAIAGVSVVSEGFKVKWLKWFTGPLAIQLATMPVMLWFYYEIPIYSIFLNLLVVPLMSLIMISAIGCGLLGLISISAGCFFAGIGHYILILFRYACEGMLSLPGSVFVAGKPQMWQVVLYYIILILFSMRGKIIRYMKRNPKKAKSKIKTRKCGSMTDSRRFGEDVNILYNVGIFIVDTGFKALLVIAIFVLLLRNRSGLEVTFLDVGQGDAIFIGMPDGGNVFIDGGSTSTKNIYDKVIEPFFKYKGVRKIDFLFITHSDADHENGWSEALAENFQSNLYGNTGYLDRLKGIFKNINHMNNESKKNGVMTYIPKVDKLVLNESDFEKYEAALYQKKKLAESACIRKTAGSDMEAVQMDGIEIADSIESIAINMFYRGTDILCSQYLTKYIFDECGITSLNGKSTIYQEENENDNSIVLLLEYKGFSMLFTGDMTSKKEAFVAQGIKKCGLDSLSILKVGHHGSKYSSDEEFLSAITPKIAVISCAAKNSYGHPHSEVLQRLKNVDATVFRTDEGGAVIAAVKKISKQMLVWEYGSK